MGLVGSQEQYVTSVEKLLLFGVRKPKVSRLTELEDTQVKEIFVLLEQSFDDYLVDSSEQTGKDT